MDYGTNVSWHTELHFASLQVIFMASYALASYTSSNLSGTYGSVDGVSTLNAFLGGFLLLFGARLASGCTRYFKLECFNICFYIVYVLLFLSGHGLSGMGLLNVLSFINVPSLFAGGMGLQFIRNLL